MKYLLILLLPVTNLVMVRSPGGGIGLGQGGK